MSRLRQNRIDEALKLLFAAPEEYPRLQTIPRNITLHQLASQVHDSKDSQRSNFD